MQLSDETLDLTISQNKYPSFLCSREKPFPSLLTCAVHQMLTLPSKPSKNPFHAPSPTLETSHQLQLRYHRICWMPACMCHRSEGKMVIIISVVLDLSGCYAHGLCCKTACTWQESGRRVKRCALGLTLCFWQLCNQALPWRGPQPAAPHPSIEAKADIEAPVYLCAS